MLDRKTLLLIFVVGVMIWALSIPFVYLFFAPARTAAEFGGMFGAVHALFSGLALGGVVYTLLLQNAEIRSTQRMLEDSIRATELAARVSAYGWLLQECENTLQRYDRWGKKPGSDYFNVSTKVREKADGFRLQLEALEEELARRHTPAASTDTQVAVSSPLAAETPASES